MNTSKLAMFVACLSMFSISANAEYTEYKIKDAIEDAKAQQSGTANYR